MGSTSNAQGLFTFHFRTINAVGATQDAAYVEWYQTRKNANALSRQRGYMRRDIEPLDGEWSEQRMKCMDVSLFDIRLLIGVSDDGNAPKWKEAYGARIRQ